MASTLPQRRRPRARPAPATVARPPGVSRVLGRYQSRTAAANSAGCSIGVRWPAPGDLHQGGPADSPRPSPARRVGRRGDRVVGPDHDQDRASLGCGQRRRRVRRIAIARWAQAKRRVPAAPAADRLGPWRPTPPPPVPAAGRPGRSPDGSPCRLRVGRLGPAGRQRPPACRRVLRVSASTQPGDPLRPVGEAAAGRRSRPSRRRRSPPGRCPRRRAERLPRPRTRPGRVRSPAPAPSRRIRGGPG